MRAELYFLSSQKNRPSLFGMPLIVPCTADTRGRDLYNTVWTQVSRLASPLPPQESSNHAQDWSVSQLYDRMDDAGFISCQDLCCNGKECCFLSCNLFVFFSKCLVGYVWNLHTNLNVVNVEMPFNVPISVPINVHQCACDVLRQCCQNVVIFELPAWIFFFSLSC